MRLLMTLASSIILASAAKICSYHGGSEIHGIENLKLDMKSGLLTLKQLKQSQQPNVHARNVKTATLRRKL